MKIQLKFAGVLALFLASLVLNAQATILTYNFSGTMTSVASPLQTVLPSGQTFTGTFSIDDSTGDASSDPTLGLYFGALTAFSVQVGTSLFGGTNGAYEVYDQNPTPSVDRVYVTNSQNVTGPSPSGLNLNFIRINFAGPGNLNLVSNDTIASTIANLQNFPSIEIQFAYFPPNFSFVSNAFGTVDQISSTVPEPNSMALMALGFALIAIVRRKKVQAK